jgi:hypothetical protein
VDDARAAVEAFFAGFNARDIEAIRASLHYPHIRFASGRIITANQPGDYVIPFERLAEHEGWHHSTLDRCEPVHEGPDKVHFDVRFRRYHEDGECYAEHRALWVITRQDDGWGVQARSSYAP